MGNPKIFHAAPTLLDKNNIPAQFVVINVDGIDKVVPLPRALNFLDRKLSEGIGSSQADIEKLRNRLQVIEKVLEDVYKFKGDVFSLDYLPEKPEKGDCYNVLHSFTLDDSVYPAGTNIAWTGKKWDTLGGRIEVDETMQQQIIDLLNPRLKELAESAVTEVLNWNQI